MSFVLSLCGSAALPDFRIEKLLHKARALGMGEFTLRSEYWYFAASAQPLDADTTAKLAALLDAEVVAEPVADTHADGHFFLITPRIGTISPWASKATDIAHNCGLAQIERIERGMAVYVCGSMSEAQRQQWAAL